MNFSEHSSFSLPPKRSEENAGIKPSSPDADKPSLVGATRDELAAALRSLEIPEREIKMRVAQLWHWIYFQGAASFDVMLNVSKALRGKLDAHFGLQRPEVVTE